MKAKIIFMLVLGIALSTGTAVWGQPFPGGFGGPGMHRPHVEETALMMLDLDDTQKTQIAEVVARYRQQERNLMAENRGMHRKIAEVLFAEAFDETAAREAFRKDSAIHEDLLVLKGRMLSKIRSLLTPGQISELAAMREKRIEARARHREFNALVDEAMGGGQ
jgi:Spy/CpxP family protein refolding chaperone